MKFFTLPLILSLLSTLASSRPLLSYHHRLQYGSNSSLSSSTWITAGATWYGNPDGPGSTGGSCGYGPAVHDIPYSSMVSAVSPNLYYSGEGCGSCYKVKCRSHASCSNIPVTVVITDSCLGCVPSNVQFDMSGTAFGALAIPGEEEELRNAGQILIQYRRTRCNFGGTGLTFMVDSGSNSYYIAVVVEFEDGRGDLSKVEMMEGGYGSQWEEMQHSWGAVWDINSYTGSPLNPPFSFRLTPMGSYQAPLVVRHAIPQGWLPGSTYRSRANFRV